MLPEGKVKKDIKAWLLAHGIYPAGHEVFYPPANRMGVRPAVEVNGWYWMPQQGAMSATGIPDFMCCIKTHMVGIEAKAPGKHATQPQQDRGNEIKAAGGAWLCVDDVSELRPLEKEFDLG